MSYVSTLIGNRIVRKQRAHVALANAVEMLEGRQLLSTVSISSPSVNEGGNLVYNVTLNAASSKTLTVNYNLAGGTAKSGRDYNAIKPGKLTFAAGETSKTVTVKTKGNGLYSPNKTVNLHIAGATKGNSIKGNGNGVGTIINTDAAPTITISNARTTEGNGGTKFLNFTVKMTGANSESPIKINYATANATATAGSDYNAAKGVLTFTTKNKPQTIKIGIRGDKTAEANEAFLVKLSNVKGTTATIVNPLVSGAAFAVGAIANDDGTTLSDGTVATTSPAAVSINRGGTAGVNVILNQISADPVTVTYNTADGTATSAADYNAATGTITLNPGETSKTITVTTKDAATIGSAFNVALSSPTVATLGTPSTSTVTIVDVANLPSLSVGDLTITEGNGGTKNATVRISLSSAATQPITAGYATANGTATAGSDYTATSGTVTFAAGETFKDILIPITGDTTAEGNETFTLTLTQPVNAPITKAFGTVTITDDDTAVVDNTGITVNGPTGHTFTSGKLSNFHYDVTSSRSTPLTNLQMQFFLVHAGQDVATLTPYKTVNLGTINPGQTLTGDVDMTGSPDFTLGSGDKYTTLFVANGVTFASSSSIPL